MHLVDVYWCRDARRIHGAERGPGPLDADPSSRSAGSFSPPSGGCRVGAPLVPVGDPRLAESLAFENV